VRGYSNQEPRLLPAQLPAKPQPPMPSRVTHRRTSHIRAPVSGAASRGSPERDRAAAVAFATAVMEQRAPASPAPRTPNRLAVETVLAKDVRRSGRSDVNRH